MKEKYFVFDDCMLNNVLNKIKEITSIEKFHAMILR